MTREEQIDHWVERRGTCDRPGRDCNPERCVYKASKHGPCISAKIYSWAMAEKKREGMCESIWD